MRMCKSIRALFVIVCLIVAGHTQARDLELKNLRWDWEAYDQSAEKFVPYFKHEEPDAIRFELDLSKYRNAQLKVTLPSNYFVWVENELVFASENKTTKYFPLDSLFSSYKKRRLYISLYSANFDGNAIETSIVNVQSDRDSFVKEEAIAERQENEKLDLFIIISVTTMALIAMLRAFNFRLFQEYFSLGKSIQLRQNFDLITAHAPLAWPNIGFILFYSVLVGSTVVAGDLFFVDEEAVFRFHSSMENSLMTGLGISFYCFLLMIAKLALITAGTELFKLRKIRLIHFFTYFRLSLIMAILAFSMSIVNGIFGGVLVNKWLAWLQGAVVFFWFGRFTLIFFVLNKIYTFRKLHLFSYLCSSELIPLLLFFKIFLK